ncbi:hypothetical protein EIP91_007616 [Steccherinum ochraceum]|uniref:Uncharacterized protein n=1 Tax=Steccherinum ochraceum TaxID=92696 RepID=A0A4R0R430_9APHY|nr:hypothetical protein EIP91_007616 [Steccherinum ochraceum]
MSSSAALPSQRLVLVPQKLYVPKTKPKDADTLYPFPPIPFLIRSAPGKVSSGIPLSTIFAAPSEAAAAAHLNQVLVDPSEKVFKDAYRAYLRILWPGYEHVEFVTSIPLRTSTGRITRAQLVLFVAKTVKQYFASLAAHTPLPTQAQWAVAPRGKYRTEDLVLVALHLAHGNTFQAEFKVPA